MLAKVLVGSALLCGLFWSVGAQLQYVAFRGNGTNGQNIYLQLFYFPNHTLTEVEEEYPHRIVGGRPIPITQAPWQVALSDNGVFICGGSIIARRWILTAAHCVSQRGRYRIRAGSRFFSRSGQRRLVDRVIVHTNYRPRTNANDIALLRLSAPLNYNTHVRRVRLAAPRFRLPDFFRVTGWGLTNENGYNSPRNLQRVQVSRVNRQRCSFLYRNVSPITSRMVCAASRGRDACTGDSGGPLVLNHVQYGIVSFGVGCARRNYPGVYTDVRAYRAFITSTMRRNRK